MRHFLRTHHHVGVLPFFKAAIYRAAKVKSRIRYVLYEILNVFGALHISGQKEGGDVAILHYIS